MSKEEQAHYKFYNDLDEISATALECLSPVHVLASGIDYYLTQAYKSAPSPEEAEVLIDASVNRAKEENNG
tara:strand:- start:349 stop:561 length:213 start_codon:yes stop_codon:yes gene_type:complete